MPFSYARDWNESVPVDTDDASTIAELMRQLKEDLRESIEHFRWPYSELYYDNGNQSGDVILDYEEGNVHIMTLTGDVTSVNVTNVPEDRFASLKLIIKQDSTGGHSLTWGAAITPPQGFDVEISEAADTMTIVQLWSIDSGTNIYSMLGGFGYDIS
jgi:hypothetical protein